MRSVARINLAAIERNVARLRAALTPGAAFCAVVKADAYGHGSVAVARAALAGGADRLAVVTAAEATTLRQAGIDPRLLVLGPLQDAELDEALDAGAEVVAWDDATVGRLVDVGRPASVHLKLDSGMGRLGQRDPERLLALCETVTDAAHLQLVGVMTHFATADDRDDAFFGEQLDRFTAVADRVRTRFPGLTVHAANSAATLREPASHFDMVRSGIAIYGMDPFGRDPAEHGLEPALSWESWLASSKPCEPGDSVGYGRRFIADRTTRIGNVPVGYADGVRRHLSSGGGEVLVDGRRVPMVGTVSMDSFGIDLGPDAGEPVGADVTLIGGGGDERILAEDLAALLGTINYEVTCAIGARVRRVYHRDGEPLAGASA